MSDTSTMHRTTVVDANVLINLIHASLLHLLGGVPPYEFVVPEDVLSEITEPTQRDQLDRAIADGRLRVETITEPDDLARYVELRRTLGKGEAACLVLAKRHGWLIACDEKGRFRTQAVAILGPGQIINTPGLLVAAIRAGVISVDDADRAKMILERHRFRMPFNTFRDVVSGGS